MSPTIAVVDRTGTLSDAVRAVRRALDPLPQVVDVKRHSDFDLGGVQADVLVLGTKELTVAGLRRALRWALEHPDSAVIAHLPPKSMAAPTVTVLRAHGVTAWFRGEPSEDRLLPLLHQVLPPPAGPIGQEPLGEPVQDAPPAIGAPGLVLTVCSASGGCGKTFLATNLAAAAAAVAGRRVLLLDIDLQFGEVSAALQARHPYSVLDGLYDAAGQQLEASALSEHLDELVHRSPLGFDVLLAPRDPALADLVTGGDITFVIETVASSYDVVVVDTPPVLNEVVMAALDASDTIAVIAALDVPSLRNLTTYLEVLDRMGLTAERRLVLNKVDSDVGIDMSQVHDVFGDRFVAQLPADKAASRSLNTGTVVVLSEPRSAVAKALSAAATALLPAGDVPAPPAPSTVGERLRSLFHLPSTSSGGTT